jgi:hypothetical protein
MDLLRRDLLKAASAAGVMAATGSLIPAVSAQISTPEQIAKQLELEKNYPKLRITNDFLGLEVPGYTMGETRGAAQIPKETYLCTRGPSLKELRGGTAAMLWEFDSNSQKIQCDIHGWQEQTFVCVTGRNIRSLRPELESFRAPFRQEVDGLA